MIRRSSRLYYGMYNPGDSFFIVPPTTTTEPLCLRLWVLQLQPGLVSVVCVCCAVVVMDEKLARQRLLEGGYFVALGVPPGVEFGVDLKSYQVCAHSFTITACLPCRHDDSKCSSACTCFPIASCMLRGCSVLCCKSY